MKLGYEVGVVTLKSGLLKFLEVSLRKKVGAIRSWNVQVRKFFESKSEKIFWRVQVRKFFGIRVEKFLVVPR